MRPYVFAHRGASGYEIENTIPSFKRAVSMGAGIETDLQITKDGKLICFHDSFIERKREYFSINSLNYDEIMDIKFKDGRKIPLLEEVFQFFIDKASKSRYSFDIVNRKVGLELLNLAEKYSLLNKIEITDRRLAVLSQLREKSGEIKLIYTIPENSKSFNTQSLNVERLKRGDISTVNLQCTRFIEDKFKVIVDNDLKCYIWGVNTKKYMKRVIKLKYRDQRVEAIYTDYPDKLINLVMKYFKKDNF
ncbi:MAG: glycerophosphodiester phosphodiesterase [Promethearchaeota archaeon]